MTRSSRVDRGGSRALPALGAALLLASSPLASGCRRARAPSPSLDGGGAEGSEILSKLGPRPDRQGIVSGPHLMPLEPVEAPDGGVADRIRDKAVPATVTAAAEAAEGGPCDKSLAALVVLGRAAGKAPPDRREYLRLCEQLPEPMQRCLVPHHQVAHADDCARWAAQSDREVLRAIEVLLAGDPEDGPRPSAE